MPAPRRRPEAPKILEVRIDTEAVDIDLTYGPNHYEQTITIPVEEPPTDGAVTPELVTTASGMVAQLLEESEPTTADPPH